VASGPRAPSQYLDVIEKGLKAGRLVKVLRSHLIAEEAEIAMRQDDFESILRAREASIAAEIDRLVTVGEAS
jgi:hypothetical protein